MQNNKIDIFIIKNKILLISFEISEIINKKDIYFDLELNNIKLFNKKEVFLSFPINYNLFFKLQEILETEKNIEVIEVDKNGNEINNYYIKKISLL